MSNPGFLVYSRSGQFPTTTSTQVIYRAISPVGGYNDGGFFNFTTNSATVPTTGVYSVVFKCSYAWNFFSGDEYPSWIELDINGKRHPYIAYNYVYNNDENTIILQANILLQQGDVVKTIMNFGSLDLYRQYIYGDTYFGMQRLAD